MYKWCNVRVPRKVHDAGSFSDATDCQAVVESCSVCLTILCRSLQTEESEQIRMSGVNNTSSQRSMEALSTALLVREVLPCTYNRDDPTLFFL